MGNVPHLPVGLPGRTVNPAYLPACQAVLLPEGGHLHHIIYHSKSSAYRSLRHLPNTFSSPAFTTILSHSLLQLPNIHSFCLLQLPFLPLPFLGQPRLHTIPQQAMELQHQQSCVLSADIRGSNITPDEANASRNRNALQERSANWPHEYNNHTSNTPRLKISRSPSPIGNVYARQATSTGSYFTGNVHAQHIGLAGFAAERPEKVIRYELEKLYKMLERSDKYQKYREKQPVLTPAEFIAREAAEKRAAEQRGAKDEKEKSVWPKFLEHAFWRGESIWSFRSEHVLWLRTLVQSPLTCALRSFYRSDTSGLTTICSTREVATDGSKEVHA